MRDETTVLPPLLVAEASQEAEAAAELARAAAPLSTLVPDLLIPPQKAREFGRNPWGIGDGYRVPSKPTVCDGKWP